MADIVTNKFLELLNTTDIDWTGTTIKVMALTSSATINTSVAFISELSANEISATAGYTSGGWTLSGKTDNTVSNKVVLDANDIAESSATFTDEAAYFAIYRDTGVEATSPVYGILDTLGDPKQPNAEPFSITWPVEGVIYLSQGA